MSDLYGWKGDVYVGRKAVARAAGVCPATVSDHLSRHGHLDNLGIGKGHRAPRNLVWQGKTYPSVKAVAEAAGVSRGYVYRHLSVWGHLDRLGTGRWGGKSGAAATCGRETQGRASTAVQKGATA